MGSLLRVFQNFQGGAVENLVGRRVLGLAEFFQISLLHRHDDEFCTETACDSRGDVKRTISSSGPIGRNQYAFHTSPSNKDRYGVGFCQYRVLLLALERQKHEAESNDWDDNHGRLLGKLGCPFVGPEIQKITIRYDDDG